MPGSDDLTLHSNQRTARDLLAGLVGPKNIGGRTLCCLVGPQGSGKTVLAKAICSDPDFGPAKRIAINTLILDQLSHKYPEIFEFPADTFGQEIARWGQSLQNEIKQLVQDQMLAEGLNVLDHLELLFPLRLNPVTLWYADAVGKRRVLLVLTGRMSGQKCQVGHHTLTRADQPIVELEKMQ